MQEDPSSVPEGETPRSLLMYSFDTNVDGCKPGDKVTMTGASGREQAAGERGGDSWRSLPARRAPPQPLALTLSPRFARYIFMRKSMELP
jgi:DNA replicative helicase MCM subunit Mcm2 (Cdc46/Mcm family)